MGAACIWGPAGPVEIHRIHEFHFESMSALTAAMSSPEDVAAGLCLVRLTRENATLLFAQPMEDVPHPKQA